MKILIVLTGGTIGSFEQSSIINVNQSENLQLLQMYNKKYNNQFKFDVIRPLNILSENMGISDWEILINTFKNIDISQYKGIIITHGSDTLAYTASLFGLVFCNINVPMIFVASNYILDDIRSNGIKNFENALDFIKNSDLCGVYVSYGELNKSNSIYLSTSLLSADNYMDKFCDFTGSEFAVVEDNKVIYKNTKLLKQIKNEQINKFNKQDNIILPIKFKNKVALIEPYPGIDYKLFNFSKDIKAVLHMTYHSGTSSVKGQSDIITFINDMKSKNIDVYIASIKLNESLYDTTSNMISSGAIPLYNISKECAYTKLLLAYNQKSTDAKRFMKTNRFYEIKKDISDTI